MVLWLFRYLGGDCLVPVPNLTSGEVLLLSFMVLLILRYRNIAYRPNVDSNQ